MFHNLRGLAATNVVAAGIDPKTAQARLGHSSPQLTLGIYARVTADADRNAADRVGEIIGMRYGLQEADLIVGATPAVTCPF
jgi:integrase